MICRRPAAPACWLRARPVVACTPEDTLAVAAGLMWNHDVGALPVVDAERHVVGMITDRDVCMAAYTQGRPLDQIPVSIPMSKKTITCRPEDKIAAAEKLMREARIRRLP